MQPQLQTRFNLISALGVVGTAPPIYKETVSIGTAKEIIRNHKEIIGTAAPI